MTKASDNVFPSILLTEGTEPAAPAAGRQRLYIDSTTHHLKRTDSSGVDVDLEAAGSLALDGLTDVDTTTTAPSNGDTLVYNSTSGLWVPGAGGGGGGGSLAYSAVVSKTAAYTAAVGELVLANTSGGAFAITLPTGAAVGAVISVSKSDSSTNLLTVKPPAGKQLNNKSAIGLSSPYWSLTCTHVGTDNWIVTAVTGTPTLFDPALSVIQSGTYGDDFTGASLDAKWTRVGVIAGEESYQQDGGEYMNWTGSRGPNSYYYQSAPGGDFEVIWSGKAAVSGSTMFGALILDSSGNGVAGVEYNSSPDSALIASVAGGNYNSSFQTTTGLAGSTFYGGTQPQAWMRLKKVGTAYSMAVSTDGTSWGSLSPTITWAGTPARIGFGCILGTITSIKSALFDVR